MQNSLTKIKCWRRCISNWKDGNVNTSEQIYYYQEIDFLLLLHLLFRIRRNNSFIFYSESCVFFFNICMLIAVKNLFKLP